MRVLSGIQPTGRFHWGNYFGAIQQYIQLQDEEEAYYFIANLHALTSIRDPELLRQHTLDAAMDLLALGLDPERAILFVQSDVPQVSELTWLLMTGAPMGLLERCHAYKEKKDKGLTAEAGLFTYPVLMAADILAYDSNIVPVGADQVQHIEVCRDLARSFNHQFGDVFVIPEAKVLADAAKVPGTDGEKMSKSYDNTIDPFMPETPLRKRIMKIKTDSTPVEAPKSPDTCPVFQIFRAVAGPDDERTADLDRRYRAGGLGYGDAKKQLADLILDHFKEARSRREKLIADPGFVDATLREGAAAAQEQVTKVVERARTAVGL